MKLSNGVEQYVTSDVAIIDALKASGYKEVVEKPKARRKKEE